MNDIALLLTGFVLLIIGGEALVRGSVAVAERAGLSPLFIGIALVGFGTSVPELVTSVQASFRGSPGIAIGSFVGSNISNILLILGLAALLMPLKINLDRFKRNAALVLLVAILFALASLIAPLNPIIGTIYLVLLLAYLTSAYFHEKSLPVPDHAPPLDIAKAMPRLEGEPRITSKAHAEYTARMGIAMPLLLTLAGVATIVLGGKVLVDGAIGLARNLGVNETIIGLTVVAIGTSMPEMATSIIAVYRKQTDVAIGNILGSNIYNTLGIGGVVGLIAPTDVPGQIITYDNLIVIAATVALLLFALIGKGTIQRATGAAMLCAYGLYLWSVWPG